MSRFAKMPVKITEGVKVEVNDGGVTVTGVKGTLMKKIPEIIEVVIVDGNVSVKNKEKLVTKFGLSIQGTVKSHITNMIKGVSSGFEKKLEIIGTGYRAELKGNDLVLTVGFSHPVTIAAPAGIKFEIVKNVITVSGADKEVVGEIAARIKRVRMPDPYKGKGIRYLGEILKLKPGKQAAKAAA